MGRFTIHIISVFSLLTMALLAFAAQRGAWEGEGLPNRAVGNVLAVAQAIPTAGWLVATAAALLMTGAAITLMAFHRAR